MTTGKMSPLLSVVFGNGWSGRLPEDPPHYVGEYRGFGVWEVSVDNTDPPTVEYAWDHGQAPWLDTIQDQIDLFLYEEEGW